MMHKVLIFANCHGAIYRTALKASDKERVLETEHIISYENLGNFEELEPKFRQCDILVVQPVQNYSKLKLENLRPILKDDCLIVTVPFFRFNGYWDKADVRELSRFTQPAVMFFPDVRSAEDVDRYLTGPVDADSVRTRFDQGIEELRGLEALGDIAFVDFFLEHHKRIPMFRDPYHPTQCVYDYIAHQVVSLAKRKVPSLQIDDFSVPASWEKEYGHFKPIQDGVAAALELDYDLDSFFTFTRREYLEQIVSHEATAATADGEKIDDLRKLRELLLAQPAQVA